MLNSIIKFSIQQKLLISIFVFALIGAGVFSLTKLPIDAVPDITNNQVQVITQSPNLAPLEIERYITTPIELSTANIPGLIETRSISRFGLSVVTLVLTDETDVYWARAQTTEKLKGAQEMIPAGIAAPTLAPVSTGLSEIFQYTLTVDENSDSAYSLMDLRTIQDWVLRRDLLRVPGVADVSSFGGFLKQYQVKVDPELLKSTDISLDELFTALESGSNNTGAAYIEKADKAYFIRGIGMAKGIYDIENTVVKNIDGVPILVKDLAKVEHGHGVRYGAMSSNGKGETVGGILLMLKGENASQVIDRVKAKIEEIQATLPPGIKVEPFIDRESLVNRAISTVSKNLIEGGLIVIFVLVLLLGNLRAGLIVASVIPLSMLFALCMMSLFGVSGNLMSLGAIDFGLIVDGAVIIVEIVVRKVSERVKLSGKLLTKQEFEETVYTGASEIMSSASFGQIIILIVYIPILALTGIEGKMFKPMALTVIFAITGAAILCLTYVPMISAVFLSRKTEEKETFADKIIHTMKRVYLPTLNLSLLHKRKIVGASLLLLVGAYVVFTKLGGEFIPELNEGDYAIETRMLPGTSLTQSLAVAGKIEKMLLDSFPNEIEKVVSKVGTSEIPTDPMPIEAMDIIVILKDKENWTRASNKQELDLLLELVLGNFPGVLFSIQQPIQMRFNELMTSAKTDVVVKLYGADLHVLTEKANEIASIVSKTIGTGDVQVQKIEGLPQIQIEYNRARLANYGITVKQVNDVVQTAFAGKKAGVIFEEEKGFDLVVKLDESHRDDGSDLNELMLTTPNKQMIPLKEVAEVKIENGPAEISRDNTKRKINIGFNARGRDVESIVNELKEKINTQIKIPTGYSIQYGGQFENLAHAKNRLGFVLPLALIIIFFLLYLSFHSVKQSLLILTAIPLAAVGGVLSLYIRDMPFSISAGVGFIALFGVAVLNGIVLIGYLNQLEAEGFSDVDVRIKKALDERFRPVIMTALVASLGFLPMALSHGAGAEVQKPLATVVIGGLITSTLLTLLVLPVLYALTQKRKKRIPNIAIVIALLLLVSTTQAQTQTSFPTMEAAVDSALKNHPLIQLADQNIAQQKAAKSGSFNPPPLNVLWQVPVGTSYRPSILQSFDFPAVYTSQSGMYKQQIKMAEAEKGMSKSVLAKAVKDNYQQLIYALSLVKELAYQDSLYSLLNKNVALKYKLGDISNLDKLTTESNYALVQNQRKVAEADLAKITEQFRSLTGIKGPIETEGVLAQKTKEVIPVMDSTATSANPQLSFYKENIKMREKSLAASKWRMAPGFTVGYFNQLEGKTEEKYHLQYGIQIPLLFWTQTSKIKVDKIGVKKAQTELNLANRNLSLQYQQAVVDYQTQRNNLGFYETTGLPQANEMIRVAQRGFEIGDISYFAFITNMDKAFRIRFDYLSAIRTYNLSVNQLQYLTGDNK